MDRLVDYFAVVGYDFDGEDKEDALRGKVFFRVPETDWKDLPFTSGIQLFCQPGGWYLSKEKVPPTFFVSVLTDEEGKQQYCAVLSFSEPMHTHSPTHATRTIRKARSSSQTSKNITSEMEIVENGLPLDYTHGDEYIDEDMCRVENEDVEYTSEPLSNEHSKKDSKYAPKCLVLLSRVDDFRILKNSLGIIYTVYIESQRHSIENIVAKLLLIQVPPPGSSQLRFSIGTSDLQALQTPKSLQLPITRSSVSMLLGQLGILNVLNILCAALIDQKLLFYSCSYIRLTEACNALTALMYPFKYSYPYIPILPRHLIECTSSPTPFLFGVHSSFKGEITELLDVITVDLDGGVITIPECVTLPAIPQPYYSSVVEALTKVLCPDLVVADWAYPPEQVRSSEPERLDKEIRAIFLRLFSQLMMGYRSCLQVSRIHPKPIIRFQKEQYLTMRGFDVTDSSSSNEFIPKLIESQAFSLFVQDNGPPFRCLHKFDHVVSQTPERIQSDLNDVYEALKHNKELAYDLYVNENPNHMPLNERIPKPSEKSYARTTQRRFPKLSVTAVQAFMEENRSNVERERNFKPKKAIRKRVPEGTRPISQRAGGISTSTRRLEVLKNCLTFIFESKTLEIKKIFQAVIRAMKSIAVRHAMALELMTYAKQHALLDNQQFDYIARLINSALQDSSGQLDEYTLAADFLPLVTTFHRKLCPTVTQFLYLEVQEHPVWTSSGFWESAFFDDVQDEIQLLYKDCLSNQKNLSRIQSPRSRTGSPIHSSSTRNGTDFTSNNRAAKKKDCRGRRDNQLCMEIAAIQLEEWNEKMPDEQQEIASNEENVVFSQAMHIAQRMVFMLVPLDSSRVNRNRFLRPNPGEENSSNSHFTSSIDGSRTGSMDHDMQFDEPSEGAGDVSASVSKFISRFVDRVCTEACISNDHTKALLTRVPPMVRMQVESLQDVCRESKRLPPIMKPKLLQPRLLPGEAPVLRKPLRAFLAFDGRATATGGDIGGPALLPAEGALFLTTYRVIFIGTPCDALAAEQVVIRSFPVSSLFKVKSFKVHDHPHVNEIEKGLQDGVQLRSSTFQLLLLAFDDEVDLQGLEQLHKQIHDLRYPSTIHGAFAVSSRKAINQARRSELRPKSDSMGESVATSGSKMSSAKILYKQAKRKAGLDKPNRISKLVGPDTKSRTLFYTSAMGGPGATSTLGRMPAIDEAMSKTLSDKDTMNKLFQRSCEADYKRMGFVGVSCTKFRLSRVNRLFSVCRSYPVCVVVPMTVTDEQIKSLAHCHHQSRFPAAVWIHPDTKALLLRSSAIRSRTANSLFKHGQQKLSTEGTMGSSSEEEKFLLNITSFSVQPIRPQSSLFRPSSVSSSSSMEDEGNMVPSPTLSRGSAASYTNSIRTSRVSKKWGSLARSNGKLTLEPPPLNPRITSRTSTAGLPLNGALTQAAIIEAVARQAQLYVFGDRSQLKNLRHEQRGKVMFVPVELAEPKQIRTSFKSFMKACLPADPPTTTSSQQLQDTISNYLKGVQDTLWLEQISQLIQLAGSIVDIMDIQGASVLIAIDDGLDLVPQVSSLSQLLMEPHYRTLDGFQILIEKEWLSFGHRFSHRNRFNDIDSSGFTPVFLMFLDAVYQVHQQFPMSFEFNEMYLEVLAYHAVSNRFTTFLLDSDYERLEAGILFEKNRTRSPLHSDSSDRPASPVKVNPSIRSFWDYVNAAHKRSPIFFNPLYCPTYLPSQMLRPVSSVSRLKVWPYYVREALGEGPPYDGLLGELTTGTSHNEQEATEIGEVWGGATARRLVNRCYDNIADVQPDSIKMLLNKIEGLQGELGLPIDSWGTSWKGTTSLSPQERKLPESILETRNAVRSLHKISTVDVIQKRPATREASVASERSLHGSHTDLTLPQQQYETPAPLPIFQTSSVEVRSFEGELWKQGALMKAWKLRFFVLDTTKHELRQYESRGDMYTKNIIDLKDLESVQRIEAVTSPPKNASENSYFELKITKRIYHFIAESENAAQVWVDNLQAALQ